MPMESPLCAYLHAVARALERDGVWTDRWHCVARHRGGERQHVGIMEWSDNNPAGTHAWPIGLALARFPEGWVFTGAPYDGWPERYEALPLDGWADPDDVALVVRHLLAHGAEAIPSPASLRRWSGAEAAQAALDELAADPYGYDRFLP
ncbi:hypothetical protein [Streptomyces sp. CB03238]|uniref:hypothetical protein n=1 Tax=Streptomyces sp. CB03238 TaxID=1907777 RepID=UPI000A0F7AC5|nr:hypothetical protein [Streptomyces sp. CB03238]ORT54221.1 hypothetical protein BKD26_36130 [Streptomyces sp. CB03238]